MLIIFDCDGVLVDSEKLAAEIFSDMLARIGISIDAQVCFEQFHGKTLSYCYEWIERNKNVVLPKSFHAHLCEETEIQFREKLKPVDGVVDVIRYLERKKVKYCVASNGSHKKIENSLQATGLIDYFPRRFSADDVHYGKPEPELFLFAAEQMSVMPELSFVIEDSDTGKQAALSANMSLIMFQQFGVTKQDDHCEFDNMKAILSHLKTVID